jgi:S1-C subfamily serine protease
MRVAFRSVMLWLCAVVVCLSFTTPLFAQSDLTSDQLNTLAPTVVLIIAEDAAGNVVSQGSGTIVSADGVIYTNRHVVEGASDFQIRALTDMGELPQLMFYARVAASYEEIDFAILEVDRDANKVPLDPNTLNLPHVTAASDVANIGDRVYVFGYPAATGDGYQVVTSGTIASLQNEDVNGVRVPYWYRTDAQISGGSSGGLAVNARGEFIGIPTQARAADRGFGSLGVLLSLRAINAVVNPNSVIADDSAMIVAFTVQNQSATPICDVILNPGGDFLAPDQQIASGAAATFDVAAGTYDLTLRDCNGGVLSQQNTFALNTDTPLTYAGSGAGAPPSVPPTRQNTGGGVLLLVLLFGFVGVVVVAGVGGALWYFGRRGQIPMFREWLAPQAMTKVPPPPTGTYQNVPPNIPQSPQGMRKGVPPPPQAVNISANNTLNVPTSLGPVGAAPSLLIANGIQTGRRIAIARLPLLIGRTQGDLTLPDGTLSREHASLSYENEQYIVRDFNTQSGTFINDKRVQGVAVLRPGDQLRVGQTILVFNI